MSDWISVKDRLPAVGQEVLITVRNKTKYDGKIFQDKTIIVTATLCTFYDKIYPRLEGKKYWQFDTSVGISRTIWVDVNAELQKDDWSNAGWAEATWVTAWMELPTPYKEVKDE